MLTRQLLRFSIGFEIDPKIIQYQEMIKKRQPISEAPEHGIG